MKRALALLALPLAACAPEPPTIALGAPANAPPPAVTIAAPAAKPEPPRREPLEVPSETTPPSSTGSTSWRPPSAPLRIATTAAPDAVRDPRLLGHPPHARDLLVTELQGFEAMFKAMSASDPARPALLRQMADTYAELAAGAQDRRVIVAARKAAVSYYYKLAKDHPQWCSDPAKGDGCADETKYYLALEWERQGEIPSARKTYVEVVQSFPQSRFVPSAYVAFGELFLAEADADPPKLLLAEQSYQEALKYPTPDNMVYGYAQFQLGQVYLKKGDRAQAERAFKAAIAWSSTHRAAAGAGAVATAAHEALQKLGVP
jgi:tetratricopeptide (TPR) repeat protein